MCTIGMPDIQSETEKRAYVVQDNTGHLNYFSLLIFMSLPVSANRNNNVLDREYQCSPITFCQSHWQFTQYQFITQETCHSKLVTPSTLAVKNVARGKLVNIHWNQKFSNKNLSQFSELWNWLQHKMKTLPDTKGSFRVIMQGNQTLGHSHITLDTNQLSKHIV